MYIQGILLNNIFDFLIGNYIYYLSKQKCRFQIRRCFLYKIIRLSQRYKWSPKLNMNKFPWHFVLNVISVKFVIVITDNNNFTLVSFIFLVLLVYAYVMLCTFNTIYFYNALIRFSTPRNTVENIKYIPFWYTTRSVLVDRFAHGRYVIQICCSTYTRADAQKTRILF